MDIKHIIKLKQNDNIKSILNGFEKALVHQHPRKLKSGKLTNVKEYNDSRHIHDPKYPKRFEPKDEMRIQGIIDKSNGDRNKEVRLARLMANKILDVAKARRRAYAAENENYHNVAKVFYDRVKELELGNNRKMNDSIKEEVENRNKKKSYNDLLEDWNKEIKSNSLNVIDAIKNFTVNNKLKEDEVKEFFAKRAKLKN